MPPEVRLASIAGSEQKSVLSLNNLAWLYKAQGRYAEAEPLLNARSPFGRRRWAPSTCRRTDPARPCGSSRPLHRG